MDPSERSRQEAALWERFPTLPGFGPAESVLLYVSVFAEEFETRPLLRHALGLGKRLVLPRVDRSERRLHLHHVADVDNELRPGILGILEPRPSCPLVEPGQVDWALVPGLAFDSHCFRLGRGAGHYDRLLPTMRADAPKWALALDSQHCEELPVEAHDVPLDGVAFASQVVVRPRLMDG
jgi:5-formyltetrahydrofolate cyclo-ligase